MRSRLVQECIVVPLVELAKLKNVAAKRAIAFAFANISFKKFGCRAMVEQGAVPAILAFLDHDDVKVKTNGTQILSNLLVYDDLFERVMDCGAVPQLVKLINWLFKHHKAGEYAEITEACAR